ncbi:MAG: segregation and condensation protein A [bacterium]
MVKVNLEVFEGPLDLLLFLIRKNELDIHDIPISDLTRDYLATLEQMERLDLNVAGDFLVMAAQLMVIKSRMLLPAAEVPDDETEAEDPRSELVARLLEYRQFKEAAQDLGERELHRRDVYGRTGVEAEARKALEKAASDDEQALDVNLFDLLRAFQRILDELPENSVREIQREEVSVVQKMNEVLDLLEGQESILFHQAFSGGSKVVVLATFLAVLELTRIKSILIRQATVFGEIHLYRRKDALVPPAVAGDSGPDPTDTEV